MYAHTYIASKDKTITNWLMRNHLLLVFLLVQSSVLISALPIINAPQPIKSIRMNGIIYDGDNHFDFSLMAKGQDKIRASIQLHNGGNKIEIIFNNGELWVRDGLDPEHITTTLSEEKAATNLLDLIALNPLHYFKERNGFKLTNQIFKNYELVYNNSGKTDESSDTAIPEYIRLYRLESNSRTLIRTIRYKDFHPETTPYLQPKEIILIDEDNGSEGCIVVTSYEYNSGIPEFLFEK